MGWPSSSRLRRCRGGFYCAPRNEPPRTSFDTLESTTRQACTSGMGERVIPACVVERGAKAHLALWGVAHVMISGNPPYTFVAAVDPL
jgi:hypothetical protein